MKKAMIPPTHARIYNLRVCSNSQFLISLLKIGDEFNEFNGILYDIREFCFQVTAIYFFHIPRSANGAADCLAKTALSSLLIAPVQGV